MDLTLLCPWKSFAFPEGMSVGDRGVNATPHPMRSSVFGRVISRSTTTSLHRGYTPWLHKGCWIVPTFAQLKSSKQNKTGQAPGAIPPPSPAMSLGATEQSWAHLGADASAEPSPELPDSLQVRAALVQPHSARGCDPAASSLWECCYQ